MCESQIRAEAIKWYKNIKVEWDADLRLNKDMERAIKGFIEIFFNLTEEETQSD
jgi:hypothetical protein